MPALVLVHLLTPHQEMEFWRFFSCLSKCRIELYQPAYAINEDLEDEGVSLQTAMDDRILKLVKTILKYETFTLSLQTFINLMSDLEREDEDRELVTIVPKSR